MFQHKDVEEMEKQLNNDFKNIYYWFVDNRLKGKETNLPNDYFLLRLGAGNWFFKETFNFNYNFVFYDLKTSFEVACSVQIWKKRFCQNSDKFGYSFIKNDVMLMCIFCI